MSHPEDERPDPTGPEQAPAASDEPRHELPAAGDTQPIQPGPSYPPPSVPASTGSRPDGPSGWQGYGAPMSGPVDPGPVGPQPAMPYRGGSTAYAPPQQHTTSRFPGWAWPVMTALALVVGALGGVLGSLAVTSSMRSVTGTVSVLSTDNGATAPLAADNGSIRAVAAKVLPSTVQIQANGGADGTTKGGATGSGFVLDDKEHVITNNHVVSDATGAGAIKVVDQNGKKYAATIIGRSPVYDLAVLEVQKAPALPPASIGSSQALRVGDTVVAIGSPLGLSSTVTSGIVSALNRPVTTGGALSASQSYINALQTDAAINPGNSGGPLVNIRGQVVGVNSAIATTGGAIGGESGNIGVGFAIPMEQVRVTAAQILATGKARYPVIGANVDTAGNSTAGAKVVDVPSGSPAAAGGLREGDVVTRVDGQPITDGISLIVAIRSHQPGETVDLSVKRAGKSRDVQVTLDSKVG